MKKNLLLLWLLMFTNVVLAQNLPNNFYRVQVGGTNATISNPTTMAFLPDGRILVADQSGKLLVIKNDILLPIPFVTLSVDATGERGLIGIAIDPDFTINGYIYLYYTVKGAGNNPSHNRISRFTADKVNKDIADVGVGETILLELSNLDLKATNHNGGCLGFGIDGKLFVAIGDNAHGGDRIQQDTTAYFGKILRLNKDGSAPTDNPFYSSKNPENVASRIWAFGLRNPYTFSIQPITGKLFLNEVGQNTWEEINDASIGGRNFGWPDYEGMSTDPEKLFNYKNPTFTYNHSATITQPSGCAITGGVFFSPKNTNYPLEYVDKYFFQDFCGGWIYYLDPTQNNPVVKKFGDGLGFNTLGLNVSPDGNLYYLNRVNKALFRIEYDTKFLILQSPQSKTVHVGESVSFQVLPSGTGPFTYQWQKNGIDIANSDLIDYSIKNIQFQDSGSYRVKVMKADGSVLISNEAKLTVLPTNSKPTAMILSPLKIPQQYYIAGDTITLLGNGVDKEDGTLPLSVYEWHVDFHHNTHSHDQPPIFGQKELKIPIPNQGETSDNVWFRFTLIVKDSQGQIGIDSVDVYPRKSIITLATNPAGLQLALDGQTFIADTSFVSVQGMKRTFSAPTQIKNGVHYKFVSWSNSLDSTQTIPTPTTNTKYLATFQQQLSSPTITFLNNTTAKAGDRVIITGTNFLGATAVLFGDTATESFTVISETSISAVIGKGGSGNVTVTTPSGTGTFAGFTFVPKPIILTNGSTTHLWDGKGVVLFTNLGKGFTYQWLRNGILISGAINSTYTAIESGDYTLRISLNGISEVSVAKQVNIVFGLASNNFSIVINGTSCNGSNNGILSIKAATKLNYIATLTGNGSPKIMTFTDSVTINNLPAATYNLCITIDGQSNYSNCYTVSVTQPSPLTVFAKVNDVLGNIELELNGANLYHILVNNKVYNVTGSNFSALLEPGNNDIMVSTDKECQGVFTKLINLNQNLSPYPNPFQNILYLNFGSPTLGPENISVYNLNTGVEVFHADYKNLTGVLPINLSTLPKGAYGLNLIINNTKKTFKIIK